MSHTAVCWQCGASLAALTLPLSRFDACRACGADLHVCRQCQFHAPTVAKQCREPVAEEVPNKQRANICDYFSPHLGAFKPAQSSDASAAAQLAALFGGAQAKPETDAVAEKVKDKSVAVATARHSLDELFKK